MKGNRLESAIEKAENTLKALRMIKSVCELPTNNVYEIAMQQYILLEGTAPAAQYLNEKGYRVPSATGQRKYISTDITHIIEDESIHDQVNPKILYLAKRLRKGKAYSSRADKLLWIMPDYYRQFGD